LVTTSERKWSEAILGHEGLRGSSRTGRRRRFQD
jgi:hypothetical protein